MKKLRLLIVMFCLPLWLFAQKEYSGKVLDSSGLAPLSGAVVQVLGTSVTTVTSDSGTFSIKANSGNNIKITLVGYKTLTTKLGDNSEPEFLLGPDAGNLEQVIVVGYGTQRKIDVTGSVTQIKGDEISKQGVVNPISGLQGKVAGVQITNNGTPGASPQILIRGMGSYNGSSAPLYVVDGVWLSDISYLNPSDIENMSILKDASSEAIYGVRGANGVVLITTKKGSSRGISVTYNGSVGLQHATNIPKMANGVEYATLINELTRLSGGTNILDSSKFGTGTNWFNQETRDAVITNHQLSINGGSENNTYNASIGYMNQDGILKSNSYKRFTANFKNDIKVSKYIKFGYNVLGTYSKSYDAPGSIWRQLYTAPPIISPKNADGTYGNTNDYGLGSSVSNPQITMDYNNATSQNYNINGNAYLDINFAKHFTWHSSFGGIYTNVDQRSFTPVYNYDSTLSTQKYIQFSAHNTLTEAQLSTKNWIVENTLTYSNTFGDHRLTALVGQTAYRNLYTELHTSAVDGSLSSDPATWYYFQGADGSSVYNVTPSSTGYQTYPALEKVSSYFGRVTYSFRNTYTFTGTLRSDGSSKFTANFGRAILPSFGVAWIVTNEGFMKDQKVVDLLKLKGSWGRVGNSSIPAYVATQTAYTSGGVIYGNTGNISGSQSIASLVPPSLNWELGEGTDIGFEAAFFHNRLSVDGDYYNKLTKRLLFPVPIMASSGTSTSSLIQNVGTLKNRGFELNINWHDNVGSDWSYSIGANGSYNTNKFISSTVPLTALYAGANASTGGQLATITKVGQPIGEFYGYKVIGIFQTQNEIDSYTDANGTKYMQNAKPGDFKYAKLSNGGIGAIDGNDRTVIGNPNPKYYYGINTTVRYKSFDLAMDFNGVAGVDIYNGNKGLRYGNENYTKDFFDNRWHGAGTSNTNPSANIGGNSNYFINSYYVESGSYFRIRNVQLGYSLPYDLMQKLHLQNFRIYANAQNPLIFTKYKGFSPEVGGTAGQMGIDYNVYPLYATYTFGVNVTF